MNRRQLHRLQEESRALQHLACAGLAECRAFASARTASGFIWAYDGLPGLVQTGQGLLVWTSWGVLVALPRRYPIDPPSVYVSAAGCEGRPFHPNILPAPPYLLCYGQHQPLRLLDGLARRVARIIRLGRGAVMTDERNSLHGAACQPVRRLLQEAVAPLATDSSLPDWCRAFGQSPEER